ncbi:PREDICTED: uncharacterized protein LOC101813504 isoform X2 [Ficedula albicollis]|uniref:uncharacterized protein LOC101813504 isoform X2 n=1 Tax=Ficedula albicollis TaxID=59894 RepID=UPI0007AD9462|nr:PREDICTED: uncharacterized protein LOC101813504 isoform X2 [Ficedula albicollis]
MAWAQRALKALPLAILVVLVPLLVPEDEHPLEEPGPSDQAPAMESTWKYFTSTAMDGGSGDPEAEPESSGSYMTFDLFWELLAQGPNVSEASPAGQKNETGLGNSSWPVMEQPEFQTLLKESLSVLEPEPVDTEVPEAMPVPEGNSEALEPTGVDERFSRAEDTRADPSPVEGMADTGTADAKLTWLAFVRAFFVISMICTLVTLLLFKMTPAWAKHIKKCLMCSRPSSELPADKELVVEV